MKRKIGARAQVSIAASCVRVNSVKRRCASTGRRSGIVWKGATTVTEVVANGQVRRRYAFVGRRYKAACGPRCGVIVRWSGIL